MGLAEEASNAIIGMRCTQEKCHRVCSNVRILPCKDTSKCEGQWGSLTTRLWQMGLPGVIVQGEESEGCLSPFRLLCEVPLPSHVVENDQKSSCHYRSQYQYKYLSSHHDGIISVLSHLLFCQLCSCQILPCLSSTMRYLQNALNNENNFLTLNIIVTPSLSLSFISSVLTGDYKETSDMLPV